jgi:hypothetical protein
MNTPIPTINRRPTKNAVRRVRNLLAPNLPRAKKTASTRPFWLSQIAIPAQRATVLLKHTGKKLLSRLKIDFQRP